MKILITGAAGFIGFHCAKQFVNDNFIVGVDNINDYYDVNLKYGRLKELGIDKEKIIDNTEVNGIDNFTFVKLDLVKDERTLDLLFSKYNFDCVINLAAQAGVRYSITNPECYIKSNIDGFFNLLECCRRHNTKKIIYASSSSVYGNADKTPFSEDENVNSPESLYAATKVANELFATVYHKIYGLSFVGLRFFTVYGPWGRPDMAPFLFTDAIINNRPINVFGHGKLFRDFTYINDIVNGIQKILYLDFEGKNELLNIGHGSPVNLLEFIKTIETELGTEANKKFCDMQQGDVYITYADTHKLEEITGYKPSVDLKEGIHHFIDWYKKYYNK